MPYNDRILHPNHDVVHFGRMNVLYFIYSYASSSMSQVTPSIPAKKKQFVAHHVMNYKSLSHHNITVLQIHIFLMASCLKD